MDITGVWQDVGNRDDTGRNIEIEGNEISCWIGYGSPEPKKKTVKFSLQKDMSFMPEYNAHNLIPEDDSDRWLDYMVHEEVIDSKTVMVLSLMCMEYDGRGRIVMATYVRKEDRNLVEDGFVSKAFQFWNSRPSTSMCNINGPQIPILGGMFGFILPDAQTAVKQQGVVDAWNCSCGQENNTGKFCIQCGSKKP